MDPPETPSRRTAPSPSFFPSLEFSPDLFQTGPSSAGPVGISALPQSRLFWDANGNIEEGGPSYRDPFGTSHLDPAAPITPSSGTSHALPSTNCISSGGGHGFSDPQNAKVLAAPLSPMPDSGGLPTGFVASPRVIAPTPENPSLFLSSPARRFGPMSHSFGSSSSTVRSGRPAYHHQTEESRREEAMQKSKRAVPAKRKSSVAKKSTKNNNGRQDDSGLQDTIGEFERNQKERNLPGDAPHQRQQSQVSFSESVAIWNDRGDWPRSGRISPLKRGYSSPPRDLDRPRSRARTSLSFTIDREGRAKTVITQLPDRQPHQGLDDAISDTDTDSIEGAHMGMAPSQNPSFAFPSLSPYDEPPDAVMYGSGTHSKVRSSSSNMGSTISSRPPSSSGNSLKGSVVGRPRSRLGVEQDLYADRDAATNGTQTHRSFTTSFADGRVLSKGQKHVSRKGTPTAAPDVVANGKGGEAQAALRAILEDRPAITRNTSHDARSSFSNLQQRQRQRQRRSIPSSPPLPSQRYHHQNSNVPSGRLDNVFSATVTDPDVANDLDLTTPPSAATDRERGGSATTTNTTVSSISNGKCNTNDGDKSIVRCICQVNTPVSNSRSMIQW